MTAYYGAARGTLAPRFRLALRLPAWAGYLAVAGTLIGLHYLLPWIGVGGAMFQVVSYNVVSLSAAGAMLLGVYRYRPAHWRPWVLLAAGQVMTAAGEITYGIQQQLLGQDTYPSAADPLYLSAYPLMAAGLLLLVRHRSPGWEAPSLIDASIVAISAILLSWIFLISPIANAADVSLAARLVSGSYPVMDLLLLSVAARLMLGAGARTTSFWLLCAFLGMLLVADTIYGAQSLLGTYTDGNFLDAIWLAAAALLGASGLHPSTRRVAERSPAPGPDATPGRLFVLAVAAVLAPVALVVQYVRGAPMHVPLVAGACVALFLLVLARMAGLVRVQRHMAITDGLTGLRTRRFFERALENEAERLHRGCGSLGLLLLDVDHFKRVNDTHGHHGGDRVLCEVAERLRTLVRPGDVVARYGGEEFAVLLPNATAADLEDVGQRIRRGIGQTPIGVGRQVLITVTVSVGAAAIPAHVENAAELTFAADRALYAAKQSGRNALVTAGAVDQG